MSTLILDYDILNMVSKNVGNLSKRAGEYANELSTKVANKFDNVAGGSSDLMSSSQYYVKGKIKALTAKRDDYNLFSTKITNLVDTANRVDKEVANRIASNKETFLNNHKNLKIEGWKENILSWLIDLKNKCPIFEIIGNAISDVLSNMSSLFDSIKFWYKCEGGKEKFAFAFAIGSAVAAICFVIAAFPISGFVALCAAVATVITAVNSIVNIFTSYRSLKAKQNGDPAWAALYGKQDKLSDVLRLKNFGSATWNTISNWGGMIIDTVELFCGAVDFLKSLSDIKTKIKGINNFFDKKHGLFSYMKEAKWKDGKILANKNGEVYTRFTFRSIWRGIKAFASDADISNFQNGKGIRTILVENFKTDWYDSTGWKKGSNWKSLSTWKDYGKTLVVGIKDTFRYGLHNIKTHGLIDFSKYSLAKNFKNIKSYGELINKTIKGIDNINGVLFENKSIMDIIGDKIKGEWYITKIGEKLKKLNKQKDDIYKNYEPILAH